MEGKIFCLRRAQHKKNREFATLNAKFAKCEGKSDARVKILRGVNFDSWNSVQCGALIITVVHTIILRTAEQPTANSTDVYYILIEQYQCKERRVLNRLSIPHFWFCMCCR